MVRYTAIHITYEYQQLCQCTTVSRRLRRCRKYLIVYHNTEHFIRTTHIPRILTTNWISKHEAIHEYWQLSQRTRIWRRRRTYRTRPISCHNISCYISFLLLRIQRFKYSEYSDACHIRKPVPATVSTHEGLAEAAHVTHVSNRFPQHDMGLHSTYHTNIGTYLNEWESHNGATRVART